MLKYFDIFCKSTMLKFNKEGEYFKTILGGLISIIYIISIIGYTINRFYLMIYRLNSNISSV